MGAGICLFGGWEMGFCVLGLGFTIKKNRKMGMGFQLEQHRLELWDLSWDLNKTIFWEMGLGPPPFTTLELVSIVSQRSLKCCLRREISFARPEFYRLCFQVSKKIIFASVSSFRFLKCLSLEAPKTRKERTRKQRKEGVGNSCTRYRLS